MRVLLVPAISRVEAGNPASLTLLCCIAASIWLASARLGMQEDGNLGKPGLTALRLQLCVLPAPK